MLKKLNRKTCIVISAILFIFYSIVNPKISVEEESVAFLESLIFFAAGLSIFASLEKNSNFTTFFLWSLAITILIPTWMILYADTSDIQFTMQIVRFLIRGIMFLLLAINSKTKQQTEENRMWLCPVYAEVLCSLMCIVSYFCIEFTARFLLVLFCESLTLFGTILLSKALMFNVDNAETEEIYMSVDKTKQSNKEETITEKTDAYAVEEICVEEDKKTNIQETKKNLKKRLIVVLILVSTIVIVLYGAIKLYDNGIIHINYPNTKKYPIQGVDVSNYQGEIDWESLVKQNVSFAFIKATEGSTYVDKQFHKNWENATKTGIRVGAYHFFSFDSSGENQAKSFCKNVPSVKNMLPPVIDVEYYGKYHSEKDINIPKAKRELRILVNALEKEYGMKPIIYCGFLYDAIYKNDFEDCDLWYGLLYSPGFNKEKSTFWQYSQNHILEGYSGKEKFIDMNVFMGSKEEFYAYPRD